MNKDTLIEIITERVIAEHRKHKDMPENQWAKIAAHKIARMLDDATPRIDMESWFYKNCKRQRRDKAKICQCCPFRSSIEEQERLNNQ